MYTSRILRKTPLPGAGCDRKKREGGGMIAQSLNRDTILAKLRHLKPELFRRYGVSRLALFGSFARDEAKAESDIDVVVELLEPDMFALVHIKEDLETDFQRRVDVIPYSDIMNSFMKTRIQSEAVYV